MSTPSRLASSVALPSARTLNPMMIASDAAARLTLVSRDTADAAVDDPQRHLVVDLDTEQRLFQRFDGA